VGNGQNADGGHLGPTLRLLAQSRPDDRGRCSKNGKPYEAAWELRSSSKGSRSAVSGPGVNVSFWF